LPQENKTAQEQQTKKPANDKKQGGNKKPTQQNNKPKKSNAILEYKGKPLVRSGNTIYYGDINDAYVVCINIKNSSKLKDIKLAEDVTIQLLSTDDSLSPKDKIIKKSEKKGLFNALDLGSAWLERQLKKG
jgi:hypothetical protein